MAERKPRSRTTSASGAPAAESKAQAEFARYKERVQPAEGSAQTAAFASPLPMAAIPAWSLQPPPAAATPPGAGPGWGPPGQWAPGQWGRGPSSGADSPSVSQGLGTTIRLGVDVLNAALSSSLLMLGGIGQTVGAVAWRDGSCGCDAGCDCCGPCACDCCSALDCGCGTCGGCCEPSVGTCC